MIRIRETPWTNAAGTTTYTVAPDAVRANLMLMASGGTGDLEESFGDRPDPSDGNWSIVEFAPDPPPDSSTDAERVRARLKELVDDSSDHQLIGVDGNVTVWSNGISTDQSAAYALGDTLFYDTTDCRGAGRWIRTTDGDTDCAPPSIILYHELAHGFLNHGSGPAAEEEAEAVDEENVFRRAQGLKERDRDRRESECGCSTIGCCIIATVATGSPTAAAVQKLRRLRDHELRATELGVHLFDEIHEEYYAFSIEVARMLATDPNARDEVRELLVEPLLLALELFAACSRMPANELAPTFEAIMSRIDTSPRTQDRVRGLVGVVAKPEQPPPMDDISAITFEAAQIIGQWLPRSPHVRWGLVEPLVALAELVEDRSATVDDVIEKYTEWLAQVPLERAIARVGDRSAALDEFVAYVTRGDCEAGVLRQRLGAWAWSEGS